jgi:hypothetical protein
VRDVPIIFSAPMVRALLDGRKTMTRRTKFSAKGPLLHWHKVQPGDRLWVRETLSKFQTYGAIKATCHYPADHTGVVAPPGIERDAPGRAVWQWEKNALPSIHMPRWASRLTLIITAMKIERLDQISEADALAEGAVFHDGHGVGHSGWRHDPEHGYVHSTARASFACLWDRLHGEGSFNACHEVVALTFTVHKHNIDALPKAEAA